MVASCARAESSGEGSGWKAEPRPPAALANWAKASSVARKSSMAEGVRPRCGESCRGAGISGDQRRSGEISGDRGRLGAIGGDQGRRGESCRGGCRCAGGARAAVAIEGRS